MENTKRYILSQVEQKKLSQAEAYAMLKELAAAGSKKKQEIAVIGMACILPEANNYHEFWENLKAGRDCLSYMPEEYETYYAPTENEGFCAVVGEDLFHGKGGGGLLVHIHGVIGDKTVHFRPQDHSFQYGGHDDLKEIIAVLRVICVLFSQVSVDLGKVDALADKGFVITAVGEDQGHNYVHRVDFSQLIAVFSVSEFFTHYFFLLFGAGLPRPIST
jgi:hypothetical protein